MARLSRCAAAGQLHLIELRWCEGVSARIRDAELDLQRQLLAGAVQRQGAALHAYALGRQRALLLMTPETSEGPARLVQELCRRLAVDIRRLYGHEGPLLVGRFRSTILQADEHLLDAMRYVEQLPAREGATPSTWRWSSVAVHSGGIRDELVTDHPVYWRIGNTPFEREAEYRLRLAEPLGGIVSRRLEAALVGGWPLGSEEFLAALAQQLRRRLTPRTAGRPRKSGE